MSVLGQPTHVYEPVECLGGGGVVFVRVVYVNSLRRRFVRSGLE